MPGGDLVEWFRSLPAFTQIFFGLFLVVVALPIATLIVYQFIETMRGMMGSRSANDSSTKNDEKKKK